MGPVERSRGMGVFGSVAARRGDRTASPMQDVAAEVAREALQMQAGSPQAALHQVGRCAVVNGWADVGTRVAIPTDREKRRLGLRIGGSTEEEFSGEGRMGADDGLGKIEQGIPVAKDDVRIAKQEQIDALVRGYRPPGRRARRSPTASRARTSGSVGFPGDGPEVCRKRAGG